MLGEDNEIVEYAIDFFDVLSCLHGVMQPVKHPNHDFVLFIY